MCARAQVSTGDTGRLQRVLAAAQRGEAITVGVIGGSITQGASASKPERRYGNVMADWWRRQFPQAKVASVNAGVGATGSAYAALRVQRDLIAHRPDFVVVEFGVNDANVRESAETLEGLVRQLLAAPSRPAVLLLFTMHHDGTNAQEWQSKVGRHYALPMVSFRDALWPEIQAGRLKWEDVEADVVHPNDRGHAYAARFITEFLADTLRTMPPQSRPAPVDASLPAPLIGDVFTRTSLLEADALHPISNQGWTYAPSERRWTANKPGSTIEFEVEGTAVLTMHYVVRGPMGRATVRVDAGAPMTLEGWFDGTWGGYRQATEVGRNLAPGKHRVRFELLGDHDSRSTGYEFVILGLGTAGR